MCFSRHLPKDVVYGDHQNCWLGAGVGLVVRLPGLAYVLLQLGNGHLT